MSTTSSATGRAAEAKAAKQKKILAVTSVIFLAVVGFQLPKLMGGGSQAAAPIDTAVAPAVPDVPASSEATAVAPGSLPDTDRVTIEPGPDQLVSFGLFKSKDPFIQQVGANSGAIAPTPIVAPPVPNGTTTSAQPPVPPGRTVPNGGLTPATTTPTLTTPSVSPSSVPVTTPTTPSGTATSPTVAPAVAPTSVSISTNGACEVVSVNGTFPADEDIFRVVSIAKNGKSAKISVVGGAYDSGAASVTLELGKKLTLVNTADGTRYVLLLQSKCDVETSPVPGSASTTPTSTVAAPTTTTTTSTVTTPIVTDALDSSAFGTGTGP